MIVNFSDCKTDLLNRAGKPALLAYQEWRHRKGYEEVVEFVEKFEHSVLFNLTPKDIALVIETTEHALGEIPKEQQIKAVEDFTCPFALQHIFHRYIERTGHIPTWQQFSKWMHKQAYPYWLEKIEPLRESLRTHYSEDRINNAIQWRLGKFYYSALRELDLLVWLRSHALNIKYHLLADVLLRVDFWINDILICIYFPNARFRANEKGRKPPAETFFKDAKPHFNILDFQVERQGFGKLWLVSEKSKKALLEEIKRALSDGG